jgi:glutamine amidotransferase
VRFIVIAIIDYGMGNLGSVKKAFSRLGYEAAITGDPAEVRKADRVILPGVGAFGACMANLKATGLDSVVRESVSSGKPFLGICLGMQLLLSVSEELGTWDGLGIVPGKVIRFDFSSLPNGDSLKIPQIGWNQIKIKKQIPLFEGVPDGSMMYFVHSYYCVPDDSSVVAAVTDHGIDYCSIIGVDNVFATQFHPEKSGEIGLQILRNFGKL